jgi:polar amino acid transport system substrate-binding protein
MRERVRPGRRAAAIGAAGSLLASLIAACGTAASPGPVAAGGPVLPSPAGVVAGPAATRGSSVVNASPACVASLRPSGPLPAPGHMPAGSTMAAIQSRKYLIVGVDQTTPLLSYRDPATGLVDGFNVAIVRQVAKAIFGNEDAVKLVAITSAQRQAVIQDRTVDIIADPTTITCDRLAWADFSTDYLDAHQRVLVPSASAVRGIEDLGGQKVCAAARTTSIRAIAVQPSHPIPVAVPNWSDCLAMLQQGQVAAISTTDTVLAGLQAQDPQTKVVGPRFTFEPQGLGMSKHARDLVRFVNAVLEQLRTDGLWKQLYARYLGTRIQPHVPSPPAPLYCAASCLD